MQKIDKSLLYSSISIILVYLTYYTLTGHFFPCLIHKVTKLYCPGCGITRMLLSILKLDFYQAFRFNPFIFILLTATIIYQLVKLITWKLLTKKIHLNNSVYIFLMIATIIFGVIRNLPDFSYLLPTLVK